MNRFALLPLIAVIAAGCASRSVPPATPSTTADPASIASQAQPTPASSQAVELRHFYLLSPGPSSKMVVTRSDVMPNPARNGELAAGDR